MQCCLRTSPLWVRLPTNGIRIGDTQSGKKQREKKSHTNTIAEPGLHRHLCMQPALIPINTYRNLTVLPPFETQITKPLETQDVFLSYQEPRFPSGKVFRFGWSHSWSPGEPLNPQQMSPPPWGKEIMTGSPSMRCKARMSNAIQTADRFSFYMTFAGTYKSRKNVQWWMSVWPCQGL